MNPIHIDDVKFPDLDFFNNSGNERKMIQIIHPEFSSVCPKTGYPDFAKIILRYVPEFVCVELKSWKLYLAEWYGVGAFHEDCMQRIADKFTASIKPRYMQIVFEWGARGGLKTITALTYTNVRGYISLPDDWPEEMFEASKQWQNM